MQDENLSSHSKLSANSSIKNFAKKIYLNSPINFSSITGWRYPHIPRLIGNPILGRLPKLFKENGVLENLFLVGKKAEEHKTGMCYYWIANKLILVITRPEHIQSLLITNHNNISRDSAYKLFKIFLGSNITVDSYDTWKTKKEIYSNWLYKPDILSQHALKMIELVKKYNHLLKEKNNTLIDLQNFFNLFTLETLLYTTILGKGVPEKCLKKLLEYQANVTHEIFEFRNVFKWLMPDILRRLIFQEPADYSKKLKTAIRKNFAEILLTPYSEEILASENFIRSIYELTEHTKVNSSLITDPNVFGDTNMMLLAGQETSISTFMFCIKLLAAHPAVKNKLCNELKTYIDPDNLTLADINKVNYLDLVIKETLRLYPPVPFLPRDVIKPFSIGDVPLKKGDIVIFAPYLTQRLPSLWENANDFIPERFTNKQKIPHQAYLPFGTGSHMCIGQRFAWQEFRLLLAMIYLNYDIDIPDNNFAVRLDQGALKPQHPTQARFVSLN